jgi:hypothetical protein
LKKNGKVIKTQSFFQYCCGPKDYNSDGENDGNDDGKE